MAAFVVLPELMAMGPTFLIGGGLSVHIRDSEGRPDAVEVQMEASAGGCWGFIHRWSQTDPLLLEEWTQELVLSLNRMAAEGMTEAEVWMPTPGPSVPARC